MTVLAIAVVLLYLAGFVFFLGFWLEDFEGTALLKPLLLAILWPVVLAGPVAFWGGCELARRRRAPRIPAAMMDRLKEQALAGAPARPA